MNENDVRRVANELVLSDGQYAYTQDTTSGIIKTHTGPTVVNVTGQELPVVYDAGTKTFKRVATLADTAMQCPLVPQGFYALLWNPSKEGKYPTARDKSISPDLRVGQRINIPGPTSFALWPRQAAQVIEGHQLRSNQYVIVRVYDEDAARENWSNGIIKPASTGDSAVALDGEAAVGTTAPADLAVGKLYVIRGTDVSFYIPPTGVEVVPEEGTSGKYVREAMTLERLEYTILIDQNGNKRYERGPQVVFPKPTEQFFEKNGQRAFKPIELNEIQGLHVKCIAAYTDVEGEHGKKNTKYEEGQELFITGKETRIYFPRPEHSLVSYDGNAKHFATAVPAGEARYVMNRISGEVKTVKGPTMLLPDPRIEVIVRRVLSDKQCSLWYPDNDEALRFNREMRSLAASSPTTRKGVVSEGELTRSAKLAAYSTSNSQVGAYERSNVSKDTPAVMADEFSRGSNYTEPRTLTLSNKFGGVPSIDLWTNYAVLVVRKDGTRRVEVGPQTLLLDYDESLEVLEFSTGKPKNTDNLLHAVYLRVQNNVVSDIILAETADHVNVAISVVLKLNFEGEDKQRWFQVENYVKFLTDHVRGLVKTKIRSLSIEAFYQASEKIVRDTILGADSTGLTFNENGMHTVEVEVLKVKIGDARISDLLDAAQHQAVETAIQLGQAAADLAATKRREAIAQERADEQALTREHLATLKIADVTRELGVAKAQVDAAVLLTAAKLTDIEAQAKNAAVLAGGDIATKQMYADFQLAADRAKQALELAGLEVETNNKCALLNAAQEGFSEALLALSNNETLVKVAQAGSAQTLFGAPSLIEGLTSAFAGTPLANVLDGVKAKMLPGTIR